LPSDRGAAGPIAWLRARLKGPGCVGALVVLAALAVLRLYGTNEILESLRLRGFDIEQRIKPRASTDEGVTIVAVDDDSLARYGQWPWPRTLMARLVGRIAAGHPKAMGVDIIFSEPDRFSPENLRAIDPEIPPPVAEALAALPSHDAGLAAALRSVPTVLGVGVTSGQTSDSSVPFRSTLIRQIGTGDVQRYVPVFDSLLRSLPEFTAVERGRGALVGNPDEDGIVRRIPLFIRSEGHNLDNITVEVLRVALGQGSVGMVITPEGLDGAEVAGLFIPTDRRGRAYPHFARRPDTPIISAAELLDPAFDTARLQGRIVLLGVTGLGLVDLKQTPLGLMNGIEVEAQIVEAMLSGEMLHRSVILTRLEQGLTVIGGLLVVFALPYRQPRTASLGLLAIVVALVGAGFIAFAVWHQLLDGIYPSIVAIITFGVMLSASLRAVTAELQHQEGELSAARAIQEGLLPRSWRETSELTTVDVDALIETAREVGGDLFDYVLLDAHHLFFAIADVSGKGYDAAVFMAMTKTAMGMATQQHGAALDQAFGLANAEISTASDHVREKGGRPMFVTAFAAVLEIDSGVIHYVSAGHDSPFLLRAGSPLSRLDTEGGPPLGTIDDFPFPVDEARLEPGDVLLLYTDGVTEAKDKSAAFYGSARLERVVSGIAIGTAKAAVDAVRTDLRKFVGEADQADDITLLAVRWLGPLGAVTAP
jgi:serine phosphatase RsbU (regulator of sigma subunit)